MTPRITHMQLLRQERSPLVALAGLAFVMRLCLLVLASALSPQTAASAGLTSLCQPSALEQGVPASHDPLACQCGPICAHGCALGPCLAADPSAEGRTPASQSVAAAVPQGSPVQRGLDRTRAIRAPPLS
ncbi:hypothetical protein [Roseibium sp. Sym1]|uniref:hypothetical protein n=1 Tax=Roseibium sp. Sym1 TaxID=3016006 RepID=UPI0022B52E47|nr:hypothetical protein [Roseibium sp. Sym1]